MKTIYDYFEEEVPFIHFYDEILKVGTLYEHVLTSLVNGFVNHLEYPKKCWIKRFNDNVQDFSVSETEDFKWTKWSGKCIDLANLIESKELHVFHTDIRSLGDSIILGKLDPKVIGQPTMYLYAEAEARGCMGRFLSEDSLETISKAVEAARPEALAYDNLVKGWIRV